MVDTNNKKQKQQMIHLLLVNDKLMGDTRSVVHREDPFVSVALCLWGREGSLNCYNKEIASYHSRLHSLLRLFVRFGI